MKTRVLFSVASMFGAAVFTLSIGGPASADNFPSKPIHFIVHAGAGGGSDNMARAFAPVVGKILGQRVVVQDMPGGGGAKQLTYLRHSVKPDGYTIGTTTASIIGRMNTIFKGKFSINDFTWVTGLESEDFLFAVPADSPAKNLKDIVKMFTSHPGKYKIASYAVGSSLWIAWNIFAEGAGFKPTDAVWIPYKGSGQSAVATVGHHADMTLNFVGETLEHVRAGNLRYLAIMSDKRVSVIPDVPTVHQAGYPKVDTSYFQYRGIIAPKGVPADRVAKISEAFVKALNEPTIKKFVKNSGLAPMGYGPKRFWKFIKHFNKVTARYVKGLDLSKMKKHKK